MSIFTNQEISRPSALICWPVEFLDFKETNIYQPHVTALYFPDVTEANYTKENMLGVLREAKTPYSGKYELVSVSKREAFGPDKNVPVLKVVSSYYLGLGDRIIRMRTLLDNASMKADRTWEINPHVTVDLETLISPPEKVLLRPLELWWRDDSPVVI